MLILLDNHNNNIFWNEVGCLFLSIIIVIIITTIIIIIIINVIIIDNIIWNFSDY